MKALFSLLLLCPLLASCMTLTKRDAVWPWHSSKNICPDSGCEEKDALQAYLEAHIFCRSVHNYYESGGNTAGTTQLLIGTIGSLSGAVISPLAGGNAAKAWAGLSGATNALQTSVKENFSGSIAAKRTEAVETATTSGEQAFVKANDATGKVMAAIDMATACSMAPAKADSDALRALSK